MPYMGVLNIADAAGARMYCAQSDLRQFLKGFRIGAVFSSKRSLR